MTAPELALAARFDQACGAHSNRALARRLSISHESIRRYRRGEGQIPAIILAEVCRMQRVSVIWLLFAIGDPDDTTPQDGAAPQAPQCLASSSDLGGAADAAPKDLTEPATPPEVVVPRQDRPRVKE